MIVAAVSQGLAEDSIADPSTYLSGLTDRDSDLRREAIRAAYRPWSALRQFADLVLPRREDWNGGYCTIPRGGVVDSVLQARIRTSRYVDWLHHYELVAYDEQGVHGSDGRRFVRDSFPIAMVQARVFPQQPSELLWYVDPDSWPAQDVPPEAMRVFAWAVRRAVGTERAGQLLRYSSLRADRTGMIPAKEAKLTTLLDQVRSISDDLQVEVPKTMRSIEPDAAARQRIREQAMAMAEIGPHLPPSTLDLLSDDASVRASAVDSVAALHDKYVKWVVQKLREGPSDALKLGPTLYPATYVECLGVLGALTRDPDSEVRKALVELIDLHYGPPQRGLHGVYDSHQSLPTVVDCFPLLTTFCDLKIEADDIIQALLREGSAVRRALFAWALCQHDRELRFGCRCPWEDDFHSDRAEGKRLIDDYRPRHKGLTAEASARLDEASRIIDQIDTDWVPDTGK